ncbi:hypothetical protein [Pseudoxanthomonas winnipegensis]|uniref:Uncharacterized protein n=1 Tax=Pseudoxanthomonas winnipegensis TaxID=2480810 RepID=A0A4Q8L904_9GAMM|nr:hypothetical protein [Pseudoxanthomonas winnipegensis]RZZ81607.1 hypothetical protein EA662_17905 [Pseudoxanthomonas winnipegensis]TAA24720.1 hypothetical protein EA661_18675 [Pseudoxanthomonas winnipegensis]TAA39972.1 hypothetical protein EAT51_13375 [Pseudoxanthomonas winnipegensis]TBV74599.1 hypothetical protein EYC46_12190 [Pseudoxanthomonas winnipegensis]
MPHHETVALTGVIEHVFAHRFTLQSGDQVHLADLGPKGAEAFPLQQGLAVRLEGEQRPSEIKVTRISKKGGRFVEVEHKKPHHGPKHHHHHHPDVPADPRAALAAVKQAGWTTHGKPERKPKHFEVLAYQGEGDWTELHVDFAGTIYKQKPADPDKWGLEA